MAENEPKTATVKPRMHAVSCAVGPSSGEGSPLPAVLIGAAELSGQVCLILAVDDGKGQSLASILPLSAWNLFTAHIQMAMNDAAVLELARRERLGIKSPSIIGGGSAGGSAPEGGAGGSSGLIQ